MDSLRSIETPISAYLNVLSDAPPETRSLGESLFLQIFRDLATFTYWLAQFPNFQSPASQSALFQSISFWLRERAHLIPPDLLEALKAFLFDTILSSYDSLPADSVSALAAGQALFALKLSDGWSDFWNFFWALPNPAVIKNFLCAFSGELAIPTPAISEVKQRLTASGLANQIEVFVLEKLGEGDVLAFRTMPSLVRWSDSLLVLGSNWFPSLADGLTRPEVAQHAADAIRVLLRRSIDVSVKSSMIAALCSPERLTELTGQHHTSVAIVTSLAKLVGQIGTVTINFENPSAYFQLALNYLSLNDEVAIQIVPFLGRYIIATGADVHTAAVHALVQCIARSIDSPANAGRLSATLSEIETFAGLIAMAGGKSPGEVCPLITGLADGTVPTSLVNLSVLCLTYRIWRVCLVCLIKP
jgi:hypothetical protein